MTAPLAQVDLEAEIVRLCGLTEQVTHSLAKRARASAEADAAYKAAHAKAFLVVDGAVAVREAEATVATEDAYLARKVAEAHLLAAQEAGRNYRAQLDALRSINANHRALVSS